MAGIDKAAIGWSIAIVAAGVAVAFAGQSGQDLGVNIETPQAIVQPSTTEMPSSEESKAGTDPFADIVEEVKEQAKETPKTESVMEPEPEMAVEMGPKTVTVDMPAGTSVPGCEETNECYIPASVTVNVGDTVEWVNSDTAAHTVTSGSPADGPTGVFDSSLVLGGAVYAFTFEEAGSYDYFCMVHPWMVGDVQVN